MSLTRSLYGVWPGASDPQQPPLASLLAGFGTAMVAGAAVFGRARRTAAQLEEAIRFRAVVGQAKGILMRRLGRAVEE
jgi:ANTAR domain